MDEEMLSIAKDLLSQNYSMQEVKSILSKKGLLDDDINIIISKAISNIKTAKGAAHSSLVSKIAVKEVLDRVGYGFVTHPFINILFYFTGASFFLIGLINGLRMILSLISSSFLKEFTKVQELDKKFISHSGIIFGFSFLVMSFAIVLKSPPLYALALLAGGIGVVAHGEVYTGFLSRNTKKEHSGNFLLFISKYGILITIFSLLISGFIMDLFPIIGRPITIFGSQLKVYGYLISFEITAFAFIFSATILSYVKQKDFVKNHSMASFIGPFMTAARVHSSFFFRNKPAFLLMLASLITGLVQVIGNSFYGIFIYDAFKDSHFGGFLNVAIVFSVAAVFSLVGPWFTRTLKRHIGVSPMLVFGTLLTAMLPLSLSFNPSFPVIIIASAFSIIGASIMGMAQGFFARKLLSEDERSIYFTFLGVVLSLPLLIFIPLGSWIAQIDLMLLFKILLGLIILIATPIYFAMVFLYEKKVDNNLF